MENITLPILDVTKLVASCEVGKLLPALRQVLWASSTQNTKKQILPKYIKLVSEPPRIVGSSGQLWLYGGVPGTRAVQAIVGTVSCLKQKIELLPWQDVQAVVKYFKVYKPDIQIDIFCQVGEGGQPWWAFRVGKLDIYWCKAIRGGSDIQSAFTGFTASPQIDLWFKSKIEGPFQHLYFECGRPTGIRSAFSYERNPAEGKYYFAEAIIHTRIVPAAELLFVVAAHDLAQALKVLGKEQITCYVSRETVVLTCPTKAPGFLFALKNTSTGEKVKEEDYAVHS